jgi:biotin operon repressor
MENEVVTPEIAGISYENLCQSVFRLRHEGIMVYTIKRAGYSLHELNIPVGVPGQILAELRKCNKTARELSNLIYGDDFGAVCIAVHIHHLRQRGFNILSRQKGGYELVEELRN